MAVAWLLEDYSDAMKELFERKLNALGIRDAKSLAFILGSETDLDRAAQEIFDEDNSLEVRDTLLSLWRAAKGPGKAMISWEEKTRPPVLVPTSTMVAVGPTLPLKVKEDVGSLLIKTTMAVLSTKREVSSSSSSSSTAVKSLKNDMILEWRKVLVLCTQFLKENRMIMPRYAKLYGIDGDIVPNAAYLQVQSDSFRHGSSSPDTVLGYLKAAKLLMAWTRACNVNFTVISEFEVACFLKDQCPRGVSVPSGVYRGLIWFEKCMDAKLHTSSPIVISQSNPTREFAAAQAVTAEMASIKMLSDMEHFVNSAPTLPLQVYAGVMCTLGHGVLR